MTLPIVPAARLALTAAETVAKKAASGAAATTSSASIPTASLEARAASASMNGAGRLGRQLLLQYENGRGQDGTAKLAVDLGKKVSRDIALSHANGADAASSVASAAGKALRSEELRKLAGALGKEAMSQLLNRDEKDPAKMPATDGKSFGPPGSGANVIPRPPGGRRAAALRKALEPNSSPGGTPTVAGKAEKPAPETEGNPVTAPASMPVQSDATSQKKLAHDLGDRLSTIAKLCGTDLAKHPELAQALSELKSDGQVDEAKHKQNLSKVLDFFENEGLKNLEHRIAQTNDPELKKGFTDRHRLVRDGLKNLRKGLEAPSQPAKGEQLSPELEKIKQKTEAQLQKAEFEEMCNAMLDAQQICAQLLRKARKNALELI